MKSLRVALLAITSMLAAVLVQAQTVDEIVSKHIEAIGGKDKLSTIKTMYSEYDMDAMGNSATGTQQVIDGKGFRNDLDFGGQKITEVYTPTGGWTVNPMMGQSAPTQMPAEQAKYGKFRLWIAGALNDYAAKGYKAELNGTESINGVNAHKIKLTSPEGVEAYFYIDPNTFYLVRSVSKIDFQGQSMDLTFTFSNFEKHESGLVLPKTTEMAMPGFTLNITTKKVEINKDIDARVFDMN